MNVAVKILEMTKVCSKCGESKPRSEFGNHGAVKSGIRSECKTCRHRGYKASRGEQPFIDTRKRVAKESGRTCLTCKIEKPWEDFAVDNAAHNKRKAHCFACQSAARAAHPKKKERNRIARLKRSYGLTPEQVVRTLDAQHGRCANRACGKEISLTSPSPRDLAVIDHDHNTGKFRAILCNPCNLFLGRIEKNENLTLGLLEYATKFKQL